MVRSKKNISEDICKEMDFNLKQCDTFCKVVELSSFSKAAEELNITQASASERVANLESVIGVKLLDRLGRQIVPSSAGKLLYEKASQMLAYKRQACHELNEFLGIRRGDIYIGGSTIPGEFILPGVIGSFRKDYPGIQVRLNIGDTGSITAKVLDGILELGVVGSKEDAPSLGYDRLWDDELVLAVKPDHPWVSKKNVTIKELCEEPFIIREAGSGTRRIIEKHLRESQELTFSDFNIAGILGSSTAIKEGIKKGLGVSIISKWALESDVNSGQLKIVQVRNLKIPRNFYLIYDKRRAQSPLCRAFKEFILKLVYEQ